MENDSGVVARALVLQLFFCFDSKTLGIVKAKRSSALGELLFNNRFRMFSRIYAFEMIGSTQTYLNANLIQSSLRADFMTLGIRFYCFPDALFMDELFLFSKSYLIRATNKSFYLHPSRRFHYL